MYSKTKVDPPWEVSFFQNLSHPSILLQIAGGEKAHQVTYPYFIAFISLLNNMELIKKIYMSATKGNTNIELTKGKVFLIKSRTQFGKLFYFCNDFNKGWTRSCEKIYIWPYFFK